MKTHLAHLTAIAVAVFLTSVVSLSAQTNSTEISPKAVLAVMEHVADWQLANPSKHPSTDWTQGAGDAGFMALVGISGDPKYRDAMMVMGATNEWKLGARKYHADDQCVGQTYAELYFLYREPKMIAPMQSRFNEILEQPSAVTNLDFKQPKGAAGEQWSWCDSLFMAPPAWARLYYATGDKKYLNFAVTNWWKTTDYLYDTNEHLFFRDSTYFTKQEANGKKVFWSRGNGWVMGGLVRLLQYLPTNHPDRPRFEKLFADMASKILTCQQPDGLWRASLLDPDSYPLKETSGSGFYTYALAWGLNQGLLDRAQFEPAVRKAWAALVSCVDADGKLTHVQPIGADPKKFAEDSTEVYGVGAFLLAGSEVYRLAVWRTQITYAKQISTNEFVYPLIQFDKVPITLAVQILAKQAGVEYVFDPRLNYNQIDANGITNVGPLITARWTRVAAYKALEMTLANCDLEIVRDSDTNIFRIVSAPKTEHFPPSPIIINVTNPANFYRESETVEIKDEELSQWEPGFLEDLFGKNYIVMDGVSSRILDSQVYSFDSNSTYDTLLFQVDLAPGETRTFYILDASALAAVPSPIAKTMARYVPERFDDFAWESDRIAHRIYGQALIKAEGTISSGADVWIKRDRGLIMDKMYRSGHYHEDNGEFMDDYRVGKSRGCGGLGIWDGKKLYVSSNWKNWKLITTGPIRSEFELTYDAWDAGNGCMVSETKRFSIDAGSWFTKVQSTLSSEDKAPLTIGVGLAERPSWPDRTRWVGTNQIEGWMTYWQPEDKPKGVTATAILLPKNSVSEFTTDASDLPDAKLHEPFTQPTVEGAPAIRNLLAITKVEVDKPFTYYFGACWDRSGDFTNHLQWENYVQRFAERRDQPLQVTVGN